MLAIGVQAVDVLLEQLTDECLTLVGSPSRSSCSGVRSGGALVKRSLPSTRSVSLLTARVFVLRRPFSNVRVKSSWLSASSLVPKRAVSSSASSRSYQAWSMLSCENSSIASRYSRITRSTMALRRPAGRSMSRPAISMLAAIRLMSHSHGPGSVSSKSLGPNSR